MKLLTFNLRDDNPDVRLNVYINDMFPTLSIKKRPAMLVLPGGGYTGLSEREAEPVARAYMAHGYNAAVLYYSVGEHAVNKNPLEDASNAMLILRRHADEWDIDASKIAVIGFSAGGHLAAWISTMWNDPDICARTNVAYKGENRPDASVLCYPVITAGDRAHKGSFYRILGTNTPTDKQLEMYSLENRVDDETPPAFLWHTSEDADVPVENSLYMGAALAKHKIPFEMHVFPHGAHGLSLANSEVLPQADMYVNRWVELSAIWLNQTFGIQF